MYDEPITKDDFRYKLACIPCAKLREQKVEFKGTEIKPLLSLTTFILVILLLLRREE
jgi:hypothetical protein